MENRPKGPSSQLRIKPPSRRDAMQHRLILAQASGFLVLLGISWIDYEWLVPDFIAKLVPFSAGTIGTILESFWIILLFTVVMRVQLANWREIKILEGILPICSFCKNIRDEKKNWVSLEEYIQKHSEADFSHSLCPVCGERHYGDLYKRAMET